MYVPFASKLETCVFGCGYTAQFPCHLVTSFSIDDADVGFVASMQADRP